MPSQQSGSQVIIRRVTYSLAGQAVATRITGDPVSGNNGVFYLHTDHLGSTSLMTSSGGSVVANTTARYYPYGAWRTKPTANLTDRGFTGHLHNNIGSGSDDIGLIYMAARWYLPTTGRFISADTIIPNPTNPQGWNRYSYTFNNPLGFTDPDGHDPHWCGENSSCITNYLTSIANTGEQNFNNEPVSSGDMANHYASAAILASGSATLVEGTMYVAPSSATMVYKFVEPSGTFKWTLSLAEQEMGSGLSAMTGSSPEVAYTNMTGRALQPGQTVNYRFTTVGDLIDNKIFPLPDGGTNGIPEGHVNMYTNKGYSEQTFGRAFKGSGSITGSGGNGGSIPQEGFSGGIEIDEDFLVE